jgi:hypothetical protein
VPLALLNRLDDAALSWLVPGMVREKVTWYFKALPKAFRNRLVPIAPAVTAFLEHASARDASLPDAIRAWLRATLGDAPPPDAWDATPLPDHLAVNVVVVDAAGRELGSGRDLKSLRERLGEAAKASFAASGRRSASATSSAGTSATCPRRSRSRAAASGSRRIPRSSTRRRACRSCSRTRARRRSRRRAAASCA